MIGATVSEIESDAIAPAAARREMGGRWLLRWLRWTGWSRLLNRPARRWPGCPTSLNPEIGDGGLQLLRLRRQFLRRRRHLLRRAGVLLRHLVQLLDCLIDLVRADVLFAARGTDLGLSLIHI